MAKTNEMKSLKGKFSHKRTIVSLITLSVFTLLLLAGPANAFVLGLVIDEPNVQQGDDLTFTATVNIEAMDQYLPIKQLVLWLNGRVYKECVFDLSGDIKYGCEGISITPIKIPSKSNVGYGYSYGYNYGYDYSFGYDYGYGYNYGVGAMELEYNITLNTNYYLNGTYETRLQVLIGTKTITKYGEDITINSTSEEEASNSSNFGGGQETIDTGIGVLLYMNSTDSGKVVVVKYDTNPKTGIGIPGLGKFFGIDADQPVLNTMGNIEIRVDYTDAEVAAAGINEATLRLYYYNESANAWQAYNAPNGGVDTINNYVWAITDHFSTWGIFGNTASSSVAVITQDSGGNSMPIVNTSLVVPSTSDENNNDTTVVTPEDNIKTGLVSLITGAFIGTLGVGGSIAVLFIIIILIVASIIVLIKRRKSGKKKK